MNIGYFSIYLDLFISFNSFLYFSIYRFYTSFVKFITKYFIFDAIVN